MKKIDYKGYFEADDEVGQIFNQIKTTVSQLDYYVDKEQVELQYIESLLIDKLSGQDEKVVVLRVDKTVAIEHAVEVMDIAYRNKFKIVLATQQK